MDEGNVVVLAYFIRPREGYPGGPRVATAGLGFTDDETGAAIDRALAYIQHTHFESPILEIKSLAEFFENPTTIVEELKRRSVQDFIAINPEYIAPDDPEYEEEFYAQSE